MMSHTKNFVCLANSRKLSGRCIAGIVIDGDQAGQWVRPVSARASHEISEEERRYQTGASPQLLDTMRVQFSKPDPIDHQTENDLIDPKFYWVKTGSVDWEYAAKLAENPETLWTNGDSTYSGRNDRVSEAITKTHDRSLHLIRVPSVSIRVLAEGAAFGDNKRKVRATFIFNEITYSLIVTHPQVEDEYLSKGEGTYEIDRECLLCVSLAEIHKGSAYKLVATILPKP